MYKTNLCPMHHEHMHRRYERGRRKWIYTTR
jgi:hypothetical protein